MMNNAKMLVVALAMVASLPLVMAQQVNTQMQQNAAASAGGRQADESAGAGTNAGRGSAAADGSAAGSLAAGGSDASAAGAGSAEMRPVTGELEGKLDSKTAKAGDQVVLKTSQKIQTADGTVIPKGSRLVGHVTEVQAHQKGHAASQMGLQFDRAELKGGRSLPIHSMIQSIQPSASAMGAASMASDEAMDSPMGGAGGAVRGGGLAGGRGTGGGGLVGGAVSTTSSATGRVGSDLDSTSGRAMHTTGDVGGEATSSLAHGVSAGASGAGALGARATGIPGVMLNGDAAGSASGMLSAANRNVHLDSGTQMVLAIAAARE